MLAISTVISVVSVYDDKLTQRMVWQSIIMRFSPYWLKSGMFEDGRQLERAGHLDHRGAMLRQLLGLGERASVSLFPCFLVRSLYYIYI